MFELSGVIIYEENKLTHASVVAHGTGNSSYGAETRAILDGLTIAKKINCKNIIIATDCMSYLTKVKWEKMGVENRNQY